MHVAPRIVVHCCQLLSIVEAHLKEIGFQLLSGRPRKLFVHSPFISHQEHLRKRVAFKFLFSQGMLQKKRPLCK